MITKIVSWAKGLMPKRTEAPPPEPPAVVPMPAVVTLQNGRKASVDARGNFLGFVD